MPTSTPRGDPSEGSMAEWLVPDDLLLLLKAAAGIIEAGEHYGTAQILQDEEEEHLNRRPSA